MVETALLYGRATSSCSFRVRIALNLATVEYRNNAMKYEGQESGTDYSTLNPQCLIPLFVCGEDRIAQSLVIIEYIAETFSAKSLLPSDSAGRARVRSLAQYIVSEIQPLQNTRLDGYMAQQHWIRDGLQHIESELRSPLTGAFCHGDSPTVADCCLVPQVYNAVERYNMTLDACPIVMRIYTAAKEHTAFKKAWPDAQPDYVEPTD